MFDILNETMKCISCGACEKSCPIGISAKKMIELYRANKDEELLSYLYNINPFSQVCGYICPNEYCMKDCCKKHINIKELHKLFTNKDYHHYINIKPFNNKKIAVVGAGVAGLIATNYLIKQGYKVDLYEQSLQLGGELNLIPNNRLPENILDKEIKQILDNDNISVKKNITFNRENEKSYYKTIYCCGCKPKKIDNLKECKLSMTYDLFLNNVSDMKNIKTIAIIGGGKVAFDCAIYALDNDIIPTIFIRRNYWDMRLTDEEFEILRKRKVRVISNFEYVTHFLYEKITIIGFLRKDNFENKYVEAFDKIIVAIGKEQILPNTVDGIIIKPQNTVVETIKSTIIQLKENNL